jgi:hypothetical protein
LHHAKPLCKVLFEKPHFVPRNWSSSRHTVAKTTLTFLERSRRKVKVDSFYSFLLSPETETQRHGTTTMEEVAGVSKRIGIGIGIGLELELELDWNCSFSSPSHDEGSRASRKQEGTNETSRAETRRDEKRREETRRAIQLTKTYIICLA